MDKYLKEKSYYENRYDLYTIEECLDHTKNWQKALDGILNEEERQKGINLGLNLHLYHIKGERFKRKSVTINEWMTRDRNRDAKLENTLEPQATCFNCGKKMRNIHKDLHDWDNSSLRVLFMFECDFCKKRRGVFEDGSEYVSKSQPCPQCGKKLEFSYKEKGRIGIWGTQCSSCSFSEEEVEDLDKKETEYEEKKRAERDLLNKYRLEFCLSEHDGEDYVESMHRLDAVRDILSKAKERQENPDYNKVGELNKWTVIELEKNVSAALEKEHYCKLIFDRPQIDKYVVVPFTVQDAQLSRKEKDSEYSLRRLIKKVLVGTNWRLMTEGVSYRLGFLSGRFKGYEREEDLLQLVKSEY